MARLKSASLLFNNSDGKPPPPAVVLPGRDDEIARTKERCADDPLLGDTARFVVLPLHAGLPPERQKDVFKRPPRGARKIVLATNVAEARGASSLTFTFIHYSYSTVRDRSRDETSSPRRARRVRSSVSPWCLRGCFWRRTDDVAERAQPACVPAFVSGSCSGDSLSLSSVFRRLSVSLVRLYRPRLVVFFPVLSVTPSDSAVAPSNERTNK